MSVSYLKLQTEWQRMITRILKEGNQEHKLLAKHPEKQVDEIRKKGKTLKRIQQGEQGTVSVATEH